MVYYSEELLKENPENIIDNNLLDTVIGLPANLFYGTSIPTAVLVFKGRESRRTKDILFIDASSEFVKGKIRINYHQKTLTKLLKPMKT